MAELCPLPLLMLPPLRHIEVVVVVDASISDYKATLGIKAMYSTFYETKIDVFNLIQYNFESYLP